MKTALLLTAAALVLAERCASNRAAPTTTEASSAQASPAAALDKLDTRAPVPLLPMMANHQKQNMREHLAAVQAIVAAAATNDFGAVEQASRRIDSEQMGLMCSHMGAGAPGLTEQALAFHHAADKIGEEARGRDMPGVLAELSVTLGGCTGCHAAFKQQIVTELAPGARHGSLTLARFGEF